MIRVRFAVSPCPNDSVIFAALALGLVPPPPGLTFSFLWRDVEELNRLAMQGGAEVVKVSAAAGIALTDRFTILSAGAAFGLGAGPKLAAPRQRQGTISRIAVPGLHTTAFALLRAAVRGGALRGIVADDPVFTPLRYDLIAPAVACGEQQAGLLIHETALNVARLGLETVFDLGAWWPEAAGDLPLPLGVILAAKSLGEENVNAVAASIAESLAFARRDPAAVAPLARALAQEKDQGIIAAHVAAYVNDLSLDMGESGRRALDKLACLTAGRGFEA